MSAIRSVWREPRARIPSEIGDAQNTAAGMDAHHSLADGIHHSGHLKADPRRKVASD
jgi:hypothetical protein